MSQSISFESPAPIQVRKRQIVDSTRGRRHGPITRLMSPSDLGRVLKPFVFLDLFDMDKASFSGMGLHPHSGIATVTYLFEGSVRYEDTTGRTGTLREGGAEWFKAAGGAWHGGGPGERHSRGFQLWIALPPEHELGPVESIYQSPEDIQRDGPASILVGAYGKAKSLLPTPWPLNYLSIRLGAGESWRYQTPVDHTTAWIALATGRLATPETVQAGELVVFEPSNEAIGFFAETDTEFVLGSAAPYPHNLVLGSHSVHTSSASLREGERQIGEIQARLIREGRL
jgi:redox-sensitive bicupin YhaK (pirin superfamily)